METGSMPPALLIYDGVCGFCNAMVQWLLKHDMRDRFRYAPQQSQVAKMILLRHGIDRETMLRDNSVYIVLALNSREERILLRSDVTIFALFALGGTWRLMGRLLQIVPRRLRDAGYTLVARNRFRLAGRYASCPLPTPEERKKFLGLTDSLVQAPAERSQ